MNIESFETMLVSSISNDISKITFKYSSDMICGYVIEKFKFRYRNCIVSISNNSLYIRPRGILNIFTEYCIENDSVLELFNKILDIKREKDNSRKLSVLMQIEKALLCRYQT